MKITLSPGIGRLSAAGESVGAKIRLTVGAIARFRAVTEDSQPGRYSDNRGGDGRCPIINFLRSSTSLF
jgi:hypothetical protein